MICNLAEAKNRLTEAVNLALTVGPQTITGRSDTVILLSAKRYAELTGEIPGFKALLFQGAGLDALELRRQTSSRRDVEL